MSETTADDQQDAGSASTGTDGIVDYVQYVVEQLVADPETVDVSGSTEDGELYVDVDVAPADRGRVIGRNGRLIRSMRVVVRAAAGRAGTTASVELLEDEPAAPAAPAGEAQGGESSGDAAGTDAG